MNINAVKNKLEAAKSGMNINAVKNKLEAAKSGMKGMAAKVMCIHDCVKRLPLDRNLWWRLHGFTYMCIPF